MAHQLKRMDYRPDGIFGEFWFEGSPVPFMETLEHAYVQDDGSYLPKIPNGTYKCVRGTHELHNGVPFETFEITGVEGHSGLLFHAGNFNADSEGCVLCGQDVTTQASGQEMVTGSRHEFEFFMAKLWGVDEFDLMVC